MTDTLPRFYTSEEAAKSLQISTPFLREILKRDGAPKVARLSDSPTAPMRFTAEDIAAIGEFLRPAASPPVRRRKRRGT